MHMHQAGILNLVIKCNLDVRLHGSTVADITCDRRYCGFAYGRVIIAVCSSNMGALQGGPQCIWPTDNWLVYVR